MHEAYEIARYGRVERTIARGGQLLAVTEEGAGPAVVGLHGLTATRRYVLMGSRALERSGRQVVLYDARGHGDSAPAGDGAYTYDAMADDLEAVLTGAGIGRAVLVGASMGAHTAVRFALEHPDRISALALLTPAYDPDAFPSRLERWDALATALRERGIDGFVEAYGIDGVPPAWRETVERVIRQRLAEHRHPRAVADALAAVPRSRPFAAFGDLVAIRVPVLVVGSRDESDPEHPLALARQYAEAIPRARLVVEDEGRSPIAWQGGQLSRLLAELG